MRLLISLFVLLHSTSALACKCQELNVSDFLPYSNKIYLGKMISIQPLGDEGLFTVSLSVSEGYLGEPYDIEEVIVKPKGGCAVDLALGQSFLVFEPNDGQVNRCLMHRYDIGGIPDLSWHLEALRKIQKLHIKPSTDGHSTK